MKNTVQEMGSMGSVVKEWFPKSTDDDRGYFEQILYLFQSRSSIYARVLILSSPVNTDINYNIFGQRYTDNNDSDYVFICDLDRGEKRPWGWRLGLEEGSIWGGLGGMISGCCTPNLEAVSISA